ncbi:hypothetical protein R0J87_19745, partial [Halomonas sp. SIMBA_159]
VSLIVLAGLAIVGLGVAVALPKRSDEELAWLLDDRLGLKDRLGTAMHLTRSGVGGWNDFIVQDAERAAGQADVNKAVPVHGGRAWQWAGPVAA